MFGQIQRAQNVFLQWVLAKLFPQRILIEPSVQWYDRDDRAVLGDKFEPYWGIFCHDIISNKTGGWCYDQGPTTSQAVRTLPEFRGLSLLID